MSNVYTYNPKQVKIALGNHIVTGFAEDSFVTVDPHSDGTQVKVGCDGEVVRAISVDECYTVKLSLLQDSPTNTFLESMKKRDQESGDGYFSIIIKDIMGNEKFTADQCWVPKSASWGRGKDSTNREWELTSANGKLESGN